MATAKKELVSIVSLYLHLRSGHLNVIGGVPVTGRAEISSPFFDSRATGRCGDRGNRGGGRCVDEQLKIGWSPSSRSSALLLGELEQERKKRGSASERVPGWPLLFLWLPRVGRVRAEMGPHWVRSEGGHLALGAISTVSKVSFGEKTVNAGGACRWFHGCFTPRHPNRILTFPVRRDSVLLRHP